MYRSIRAIWLSAALAALGGGQALLAQSPTPAAPRDRFVSLEIEGDKPTRCRVLRTWTNSDGNRCLQVQAVFTGQRMTVVQKYQQGNLSDVQVYKWGLDKVSPPGAPLPQTGSEIQQASSSAPPAQLPPVDSLTTSAKSGDGKGTKGAGDTGTKGAGSKGAGDSGTKGAGSKGSGDSGSKGHGLLGTGLFSNMIHGSKSAGDHGTKGAGDSGTKGAGDTGTKGAGSKGAGDSGTKGAGSKGAGSKGAGDTGTKGAGSKGAGDTGTKGAGDHGSKSAGSKGAGDTGAKGAGDHGSKGAGSKGAGDTGTKGAGDHGSKGAGSKGVGDTGTKGAGTKGAGDHGSKGAGDHGTKGAGDHGSKGVGDTGTKGAGTKGAGDHGSKGAGDHGTKGAGGKGSSNSDGKGSDGKGSGVAVVPSTSEPAKDTGNWRQSWGQSEPVPGDKAAMSVKPLPRADRTKSDPLPTVIEAAQERLTQQEALARKYAKPAPESVFGRLGLGPKPTPASSGRAPAERPSRSGRGEREEETRASRDGSDHHGHSGGTASGRATPGTRLGLWGLLARRVGQPGTASILAAGADPEMVANFRMPDPAKVPEGYPSVPPGVAIHPAHAYTPGPKQFAPGAYVPGGLANAFSPQGHQRPIPADVPMGHPAEMNAFAVPAQPQPYPVAHQYPVPMNQGRQIVQTLPAPAPAPVMDHQQAVSTLKNALLPSEREMAAMELANRTFARNPEVVEALVLALRNDPAPAVRGCAARSLAKLGTSHSEVVQALHNQRQDTDARVRLEVDNAILQLTSATSR